MTVTERTWTQPRPDCPHPEHWHAPDPDSTEQEVSLLVGAFVRALQPELVVETGTAFGQTAEAIGAALVANEHGHLITYETDPRRAALATDRCAGLPVTVINRSSLDGSLERQIDFAWFDSLLHLRRAEFLRFRQCMTTGAIVGFHDCGPQHPVRVDVETLAQHGYLRPIYLRTPRGVMFAEVL